MDRRRIGRAIAAAGAASAIFGVAYADGSAVMERVRPEYDAKGIPLGGFRLFPSVDLRIKVSDNVFQRSFAREGDVSLELEPAFKLTSEWSQHLVEFFGRLSADRYADHSSENVNDWTIGANGRLDVQRGSAVTAGLSTSMSHEGRSSPNTPGNAAEPVQYSLFHSHGGATIQPNNLHVFLGGEIDRYSYDSTPLNGGGVLSNRDRDRDEYRLRARISHEVTEGLSAFVQGEYERRSFDVEIDRTGVDRDSSGSRIDAGIEFKLAAFLQGEVFVGRLQRQFGTPLRDYSGMDYGSTLQWSMTPLTTVHLTASRVLNETTVTGSSVIVDDTFGIGIDHELRRNLIIQAKVAFVDSTFVGTTRDDSQIVARVGATYLIDRHLNATAGYDRRQRDSNVPGQDFSEDEFNVGLHFQL